MKIKLKVKKIQKYIIAILSILIIVVMSINFYLYFEKKYQIAPLDESERVKSYMVQCYASEGFYPPKLDYLVDNYGLILKKDEFIYFYDAFSSNIMPDLIVDKQFKEREGIIINE